MARWRKENPDKVKECRIRNRAGKAVYERKRYFDNIDEMRLRSKNYYLKNKDKIAQRRIPKKDEKRWKNIHKQFHLGKDWEETKGIWETQFKNQSGKCYICRVEKATQTDHNHITGKFRGLLCNKCNLAIGLLNADFGTSLFLSAISYLEVCDESH